MNFNTTSSSKAGCTQAFPKQETLNTKKPNIRTANPTIFPSLHPLGGLYRHQPDSHATTTLEKHLDAQDPTKKIKTDSIRREVVVKTNKNEEPIRMSKKEDKKTRIRTTTSDDDVFRVPQLPKRLLNKKEKKEQKQEQNEIVQRIKEFKSVGESSLTMPDQDLMSLYYQSAAHSEVQAPFMSKIEEPITGNHCQSQDSMVINSVINPLILSALYQRLSMELYSFQLQQCMSNMVQINQ